MQLCLLQFTAAAVAATLAGVSGAPATSFLAALGATSFVAGGVLCFRGVLSEPYYAGGLAPAWWAGLLDHQRFALRNARAWAAQQMQVAIRANSEGDRLRAFHLNNSLWAAVMGAALVAAAALAKAVV